VFVLYRNKHHGAVRLGSAEWGIIKYRVHTEASGLDISLLSSCGIGVGVSKHRVLADGEMLVKAPLSRTRETRFGG